MSIENSNTVAQTAINALVEMITIEEAHDTFINILEDTLLKRSTPVTSEPSPSLRNNGILNSSQAGKLPQRFWKRYFVDLTKKEDEDNFYEFLKRSKDKGLEFDLTFYPNVSIIETDWSFGIRK